MDCRQIDCTGCDFAPTDNSELTQQEEGEGRRRQTLCDKRDNNFVCNNFSPNFTFLNTDLFVKDQKTLMLSEDHDKTRKK